MVRDHYSVLEVPRHASAEDIQHSYRALALRYHPDRNSAPEAAARMTAINEAWEVLGDPQRRRDYDRSAAKPAANPEITGAILAAREVLLRAGWRVIEDGGRTVLLEHSRQRLRFAFTDSIDNASVPRLTRQYPEFCVVLAVSVEGPIAAGLPAAVIDLTRSERHGAPVPEGAARALVASFL